MAIREGYRVYVDVNVLYHDDGYVQPLSVKWEDGTEYPVDRVLSFCRCASRKAGGTGIMYLCRVGTHEIHLYFDDFRHRWYLEAREPGSAEGSSHG